MEIRQPDPAQFEQIAKRRAEFVGSRRSDRGKTPVLNQAIAVEGAEMRLGVASVDYKEHVTNDMGRLRTCACSALNRSTKPALRVEPLAPWTGRPSSHTR